MSGEYGVSMVVLPIDGPTKTSRVFVVELAEKVVGSDGTTAGEGVLLYAVDARIASGQGPVAIVPKKGGTTPVYGSLFEAPFGVGDTASKTLGNASISVDVLQKFGSCYNVRIAFSP
jgi:hypothetical protein